MPAKLQPVTFLEETKSEEPNGNNKNSPLLFNESLAAPKEDIQLDEIIIKSKFNGQTPQERAEYILSEFNKGITNSAVTTTILPGRGQRINRDQFILAHRNEIPELVPFNQKKIARCVTLPGSVTAIVETIDQRAAFYGKNGKYVLNVPMGSYAKAMTGNGNPLIFGEGTHVVLDPTFQFKSEDGFVKQSEYYINHKTIHIVRIPAGKVAAIWIGSQPYVLPSRAEAYVFQSALFKIEKFGDSYFTDASSVHITHGTINILRVPAGTLVKAWDGPKPYLLESRDQPYITTSPLFKLSGKTIVESLVSTTEKLIVHGSIKRVTPETSEVAIVYDNGKLKVFGPSENGKPIIEDSPTYRVDSFLQTSMQTKVFPSDKSKDRRKKENKETPPDEINYEVFTTKDGLKIGVKLLVAYEISNPELAIRKLGGEERIIDHIENLAAVDMGKVIQQRSAQDFLSFDHTTVKKVAVAEEKSFDLLTDAPAPTQSIQDTVKKELGDDLAKYGITLVRLNFETPKILNAEIAKKMSEQSLLTADVNAQEAAIDKQTSVAKKKAQQAADVNKVTQDQINQTTVSTAQAKSNAAKLEAEATETQARAKANSQFIAAEMEAKSIVIKAEAEKKSRDLQGDVYKEHPELLQRDLAQLQCEALKGAHIIVAPDHIGNIFSKSMGLTLFSKDVGTGAVMIQQQAQDADNILQMRSSK